MKETFYFPHDFNAIQDPKMMTLLTECGLMGIGAFWVLIEILHQQQCGGIGVAQVKSYLAFYGKQGAWDQGMLDKCERVLFDTKLLIERDGMVYSERVINNLKRRDDLSEKGRKNARVRWGGDATALQPHCEPIAIKERKVKESNRATFTKPTLNEIWEYCKERGTKINPDKFFDFYESKGWMVGKSKMKDWRAAVRNWERSSFDQQPKKKEPEEWEQKLTNHVKETAASNQR